MIYTSFIELSQHYLGTVRDPLDCSTFYLLSVPLTFLMCICVHWGSIFGTLLVYVLIYRIATKAGSIGQRSVPKNTSKKGKKNDAYIDDGSSSGATDVSTTAGSPTADKYITTTKNAVARSQEDKERKAMRTIALLLLTFAICWIPLSIIFVITAMHPDMLSSWWMILGYWLGYVNSMLNPVCYAVGNPFFKETLIKILTRKSK